MLHDAPIIAEFECGELRNHRILNKLSLRRSEFNRTRRPSCRLRQTAGSMSVSEVLKSVSLKVFVNSRLSYRFATEIMLCGVTCITLTVDGEHGGMWKEMVKDDRRKSPET